jgi:2-epi-5-epi-valiolone synthase
MGSSSARPQVRGPFHNGGEAQVPDQDEQSSQIRSRKIVAGSDRTYDVLMIENLFEVGGPILARTLSSRSGLIVTTPTVADLYLARFISLMSAAGCEFPVLVLDCDESTKTIAQVVDICEKSLEFKLDRKGLIVGFGGGICTDLVTVAASWIRRGIDHVRVPTTLIGQIDAAIGIKGGLNFQERKSYLGCFYPPQLVVVDPQFLTSVPAVHLRSGLAEILKISIVRDARLFGLVELHADALVSSGFSRPSGEAKELLWLSILRMVEELEQNIYEDQSFERLVDFGHTFSPPLESASRFRMTHGEAVAIDMALSCMISSEFSFIDRREVTRILNAIHLAGLPLFSPLLTQSLCEDALDQAVHHRGGMLNLVVPRLVGGATFVRLREHIDSALLCRAIVGLRDRALGFESRNRFEIVQG